MSRQLFLLFHRYVGLFMAFFLIVAGISGTAIAFYEELDGWLNPKLHHAPPPSPDAERLGLDEIINKLNTTLLNKQANIRYTRLPRHNNDAIEFFFSPKKGVDTSANQAFEFNSVFVNPYTNEILGMRHFGEWRLDRAHIMPLLWELHYSLTLPGPYGEWLFGVVALLWIFDCFIAGYLTLPRTRKTFLNKWAKAWKIKISGSTARIIRDVHIAFSLWFWGLLLMLAVSGVMFNLGSQVYAPILSSLVEYEYVRDTLPEVSAEERKQSISHQAALEHARKYLREWQQEKGFEIVSEDTLSLDLGKYAYRLKAKSSLDLPNSYAQTVIYVSAADGRFLARSSPYKDTGNAISYWLAALHMGRVFGLWYQILISISGLVVAAAAISGVLIWWRKRKSGRALSASAKLQG